MDVMETRTAENVSPGRVIPMLDTLHHYLSVYRLTLRLSLQRQLEYPKPLVSWLFFVPIQYFSGVWMLKVLADRFQPIAGWTFPQIAFVYGLGSLSQSIWTILFIQTMFVDDYVLQGGFDRMLLRPMNVFFQFTFTNLNLIGLIDLFSALTIFTIASEMVGFTWKLGNILKLFLAILGAVLIRAGLFTTITSASFWVKRISSLRQITHEFLSRTSFYPLSIYPYLLQMVLTFVMPVGFIAFYPACEFLNQGKLSILPVSLAIWTPIVGVFVYGLSQFVFHSGLHRYESSGS